MFEYLSDMAKFFEWKDSYSVGDEEIDDQHRRLIDMVNHLHEHLNVGQDMRLYTQVFLERLVSYVDYHFATEERAMQESSYGDFEAHKKIHDALRAQVHEFHEKFLRNEVDASEELMTFLKEWLVSHIGVLDTKIGAHLKVKGLNRSMRDDLADVLAEFNKTRKK